MLVMLKKESNYKKKKIKKERDYYSNNIQKKNDITNITIVLAYPLPTGLELPNHASK